MNPFHHLNDRRSFLKGVSLGTGGLLLAPLLQKIAAAADGNVTPPKRVVFIVFDNGFREIDGTLPEGVPLESDKLRQIPLQGLKLPLDIEPFAPFQDRMTILHGLRGNNAVDHGGYFAALAGIPGNKHSALGVSIDAAIAQALPSVFPLLGLGIGGGTTAYCSSAWAAGKPIAMQCRPEMAYESLFGSVGATRNDFATRKNLLDFVSDDVQRVRAEIAGPEQELLEAHLEALESLSKRNGQLSDQFKTGTLNKHAPKLPEKLGLFTEIAAAQVDIATAALVAGLTNVVTISSGLGGLMDRYSGISSLSGHGCGHGDVDKNLPQKRPFEVLSHYHNYLAKQAARMLTKLQQTKEGAGTMLDNTLLVFMSDSANQQHTQKNANWPIVLVGNLGGKLKAGQFVSYPVGGGGGTSGSAGLVFGAAYNTSPYTNALYATLLHAIGKPCDAFNRSSSSSEARDVHAPLPELLNT
ncbi:hypothetical protein LBMAG57_37610 [Verrucomicrobiota bacterium]|nr:hypothetical protein LBMAG57_37610 [Verrucomicrobiota bacterium]